MKKNKKVFILTVCVIGIILIALGVVLLILTPKKDDSYERYLEEQERNYKTPEDKEITHEGHIDGEVDTIEEYQYLLENVDPPEGFTYQFVSQTDTTITFQKVDGSKKNIGTVVMDKHTFEVTYTGVEKEDSK